MIKNNIKNSFIKPLNILWFILLPITWFLGTASVRSNILFLERALKTALASPEQFSIEQARNRLTAVNGFTVFLEGSSDFYVSVAVVLLAGLIFSSSFAYDKNTGFGNFILSRIDYKKYFCLKSLVTFFTPFVFTFLTMSAILFYSLLKYSDTVPTEEFAFSMNKESASFGFFISHYWTSCFIIIFTLSLISGIYALLGMGINAFTSNRFVISIFPVSLIILLTLIPQIFPINTVMAKAMAWFFPSYLTGVFIGNSYWYTNLSPAQAYLIHIVVLAIPAIVLLSVLYIENKKQYVR